MIVANDETYILEVYKRKQNSPYEYEDTPCLVFKGRPANNVERKKYRIQKGVNGNTDSVFIFSSNLNINDLNAGDRIVYLNKIWEVQSVGFYFDSSYIVNGAIFSDDYIASRCPKGVTLQ